mmetsp:Transcript_5334/g.6972  ORF Transcript_5334/g.6972 Transcript_5334/m.6972 type:complete len:84 (-) Transcript_5334:97-348(-)
MVLACDKTCFSLFLLEVQCAKLSWQPAYDLYYIVTLKTCCEIRQMLRCCVNWLFRMLTDSKLCGASKLLLSMMTQKTTHSDCR